MNVLYYKPKGHLTVDQTDSGGLYHYWIPMRYYKVVERYDHYKVQVHIHSEGLCWMKFSKDPEFFDMLEEYFYEGVTCPECGQLRQKDHDYHGWCDHWTTGYSYENALKHLENKWKRAERLYKKHTKYNVHTKIA